MRIAVVFDTPNEGWEDADFKAEMEAGEEEAEYEIAEALLANGHDVILLGVYDDLQEMVRELEEFDPDLVFNCAETFMGKSELDYLFPALIEAAGYPYTGAGPHGMLVTRDKAISKKVLAQDGVQVPDFQLFPSGRALRPRASLGYPLVVKPVRADASEGISRASVVHNRAELGRRVRWVHERFRQGALAERYIEGRELWVGIVGNPGRLELLRLTEIVFSAPSDAPARRIATRHAKWDSAYRERHGIKSRFAWPVSRLARERIERAAAIAFESLELRDYARLDIRLAPDDEVWVLEANCNPFISFGHEMANAAEKSGLDYEEFVERIVDEAVRRHGR